MARIVIPGVPHHVTHRGNLRAQVFLNEQDRLIYLQLLAECAQRFFLEIWAQCLMSNHVHLTVVGQERNFLAKAIGNGAPALCGGRQPVRALDRALVSQPVLLDPAG